MLLRSPHLLALDAPALSTPEDQLKDCPETAQLRSSGFDPKLEFADQLKMEEFAAALAHTDILLTQTRSLGATLLEQAKKCMLIQIYGPGNGLAGIDLETARRLGIYVASLPDYASDLWAMQSMDGLLQLIKRAGWNKSSLRGRRLGLVGLGQVGRRVARQARSLGMRVFAHDPFCPEEQFAFNNVIPVACLEELIGSSQILSLHLPLAPATRGLLNQERLKLLSRESLLLNFSAPELVDLEALPSACARRHPAIAGFAATLDFAHPQIHGGLMGDPWSPEAGRSCRERVGQLLVDFLRGSRPPHLLIDPPCPRHVLLEPVAFSMI